MRDTENYSNPRNIESLVSAVTELVDQVYSSLTTIGNALTGLWDDLGEKLGTVARSTDLAPLRETITGELDRRGRLFDGAGVVMADGVLADRPRHLDWWVADPPHPPHRLTMELNRRSEYFYDYTLMDWYVIPRDQGRRWVYGPSIDFACTDQYVCTFAIPVRTTPGDFLGIAGADVPVSAIEEILLPQFRAAGPTVVLVNDEGRIILTADPGYPPGSRATRKDRSATVPIDAIPWSLQQLESTESRRTQRG